MKLLACGPFTGVWQSPPARGAWIEIFFSILDLKSLRVAPRTGGVD